VRQDSSLPLANSMPKSLNGRLSLQVTPELHRAKTGRNLLAGLAPWRNELLTYHGAMIPGNATNPQSIPLEFSEMWFLRKT